MKKSDLEAQFKKAKLFSKKYIGISISEGNREPRFLIITRSDFDNMFEYFMKEYDDNLIYKHNNEVCITDSAQGNTFEDIEYQLLEIGQGWKKPISDAIDKSYKKMITETPPSSEKERLHCEAIKEAVKGMFLNESRTAVEERFIISHINEYEKLFDICMNGNDLQFKKGLIKLQHMQNRFILEEGKCRPEK